MAVGLYSRNNLSEGGINAKEAVQKLYGPQVQEDILLFSFASRLESKISSADLNEPNQVTGFTNIPLSDSQGNVSLRTRFNTSSITFTNQNYVWFDSFQASLDKRVGQELSIGASVNVSRNGSITQVDLLNPGEGYKILTPGGVEVQLPATVNVYLSGKKSGSKDAIVSVSVTSDGKISRTSPINVISPGSGYISGEDLDFILGCTSEEIPSEDKCFRYSGNSLYQESFINNSISTKAYLKNGLYKYRVKFSTREGFFLFDERINKYVYLGSFYDTKYNMPSSDSPLVVLKRKDTISPSNILQLYNLNGKSLSWEYFSMYRLKDPLYYELRELIAKVESLQREFSLFVQNTKDQTGESDEKNTLGISYNILEGLNIISNYRLIFRDPDGVLDSGSISFNDLTSLVQAGQTSLNGVKIPGLWLWSGEKYQRAYSSSDKPFVSQSEKTYFSPALYDYQGTELPPSGAYKYSVDTGYLKPGTQVVRGFDTELSVLVQNISGVNPASGGFVYHRLLTPITYSGSSIKAWPLFSYKSNGLVKDINILAI